jgi:hypothetical protein
MRIKKNGSTLGELNPNQRNPRRMSDEQKPKRPFWQWQPIYVWQRAVAASFFGSFYSHHPALFDLKSPQSPQIL